MRAAVRHGGADRERRTLHKCRGGCGSGVRNRPGRIVRGAPRGAGWWAAVDRALSFASIRRGGAFGTRCGCGDGGWRAVADPDRRGSATVADGPRGGVRRSAARSALSTAGMGAGSRLILTTDVRAAGHEGLQVALREQAGVARAANVSVPPAKVRRSRPRRSSLLLRDHGGCRRRRRRRCRPGRRSRG